MIFKRLPMSVIARKLKEDDRQACEKGSVRPLLSKAVRSLSSILKVWKMRGFR